MDPAPITPQVINAASFVELTANGLVTLVAAFGGAFFAFALERRARRKEQEENNVAAGNRALFTLTQIWNRLIQHRIEIIDPHRGRDDAWLNMSQSPSIEDELLAFDEAKLSFLLATKPSVYQQLMLEASRFHHAASTIDRRNQMIDSKVSPIVPLNATLTDQQLEEALGGYIIKQLKTYAAGITEMVDQDIASSQEAFTALRKTLKEVYPERKFLDFSFTLA